MTPEGITATFSAVTGLVMKAYRGGVVTSSDFFDLSDHLRTQHSYEAFEELMATAFITRVPSALWNDMGRYLRSGGGPSPIATSVREHMLRRLESLGECAPAPTLLLFAHAAENYHTAVGGHDDRFVDLPKGPDRKEWARLAAHLSPDRARLYLSQGVGLPRLLSRAIAPYLATGMLLGAVRTAAVMSQVVALWILIRLANGDSALGDWGVGWRILVALVLPMGAVVQSFGQHNTFHATNTGAITARSLVLAMVFEKLRVMTPLYIGSAAGPSQKGSGLARGKVEATAPKERTPPAEGGLGAPLLLNAEESAHPVGGGGYAEAVASIVGTSPVSTGLMVNLISSDANTILEAALMLPLGLSTILDLAACLAWVSILAGWATAALFAAMSVVFGFQVYCGYRVSQNKMAVAKVCDQRLRALSEFLFGIQVVKFYAWEPNVRAMIRGLRAAEARLITRGNTWKLISLTSTFCAPGLFYLCLFGVRSTYVHDMDPITTFTIMALLATNVNRTFQTLPRSLTVVGTTAASMRRITEFLLKDVTMGLPVADGNASYDAPTPAPRGREADASLRVVSPASTDVSPLPLWLSPTASSGNGGGLSMSGDFGWPGFILHGVDLHCPPRSLTVIVGPVGSGKSTLLQAAMGMCAAMSPQYTLRLPHYSKHSAPRIAYVAQEAFIAEATVRENITFGKPYDEARYRRVLKACSLVTDLQQWGGDLVEVSGNTLSGGQRQRLSLARACYADADLYLIDDPISAVDASVARHLLRHCIKGFLGEKTVLLATHHPAPSRVADQIVTLRNGRAVCRARGVATEKVFPPSGLEGSAAASPTSCLSPTSYCSLSSEDVNGASASALENSSSFAAVEAELDAALDALLGVVRALKVAEAEAIGSVPRNVYQAYFCGGGLALLAFTIGAFFCSQALRTGGDWWFSAWTSQRYPALSDAQHVGVLGAIVAAMVLVACVRTVAFGVFTVRASSALHDRMFEAIIASPLYFFEQVPLGRIMNRFSKDLDFCDDLLPRVLFDLLQLLCIVLGSLTMQTYSVPWFAIAIPVACVLFVLLLRIYLPSSRYIKRIEAASRSPSLNTFQTAVAGLVTLRSYGRMDAVRSAYFRHCDVTINALLHSSCMQRWIAVRMDLISAMWSLCAAVLCAVLMHELGPSVVGLCLSQSVFVAGLFQFAVRMASETEMLMTSVERLHEYGSLAPEPNEGILADAVCVDDGSGGGWVQRLRSRSRSGSRHHSQQSSSRFLLSSFAGREMITTAPRSSSSSSSKQVFTPPEKADLAPAIVCVACLPPQWPAGCDIEVKGLTVSHRSNPTVPVLKNLHFTVKAGQRVAVVGRTGAGKSTLLSAFFRTVDVPADTIRIGGIATTDVDLFALRSRLGIIPQVPTLFHGTVRYNLDPFGSYSDAAMLEALAKVRLLAYIEARQGLDTAVGEGGGNLSVGQRQLLCAARVLLTGASILFMDEATANIDEETDAQIQQIMREEAARRALTIVTIAHRLNTVMDYDLVLVLSHGRLVEVGNPRELVEASEGRARGIESPSSPSSVISTQTDSEDCSLGGQSPSEFTTDVQSPDERFCFAAMVQAMGEARGSS